jgi:hypothetical protein
MTMFKLRSLGADIHAVEITWLMLKRKDVQHIYTLLDLSCTYWIDPSALWSWPPGSSLHEIELAM